MTLEDWNKTQMKAHGVHSAQELFSRVLDARGEPDLEDHNVFGWAQPRACNILAVGDGNFALTLKSRHGNYTCICVDAHAPGATYLDTNWFKSRFFVESNPIFMAREAMFKSQEKASAKEDDGQVVHDAG